MSSRTGRLTGQVAIVTGAGTGIGRAAAAALAAEGATVVLFGRRAEPLAEAVAEIQAAGGAAGFRSVDVASYPAVESAVQSVASELGRIDILVNNAGTNSPRRTFADSTLADFDDVVATNLNGVFYCIRAVLPIMRARPGGRIINVASMAAISPGLKAGVAYSASKKGVSALTTVLNAEEWANGIRATTVYPGDVATPILDKRPVPPNEAARAEMLQPEDLGQSIVFLATLPERALVEELVIRPTSRKPY